MSARALPAPVDLSSQPSGSPRTGCSTAFACFCCLFWRPTEADGSSMGSSDGAAEMAPNKWGLAFHHLGLGTGDPKAAAHFLSGLGYRIGPTIFDPLQNVHLAMCAHDRMPSVEIISPGEGPCTLDKLLSAHNEGLVYHMCYTCADLDHSLDA